MSPAMVTWHCGARNWVVGRDPDCPDNAWDTAAPRTPARRVEEAFDAIPASLALDRP